MSYLSGRFREIEGDFWVMCLRFSVDRTDVITGKYPTTLKSVCSLWTSLKFIASLRQIAANEIAAFWLGTDGKRIVLKKNNCYYPSSVWHLKSGLLQLFSLGYPQEEILSESSRTWWQEKVSWHNLVLDTNIFGQGAYLSFWVEEGRLFFFSSLHLPLPPLTEPQLLRRSHPTLRLGALPEELSGVSKDFSIPHPQQAPEDLQTITPLRPCSWQLCFASALCWGEEERFWPGEGGGRMLQALSLHCWSIIPARASRNTAQLGKAVQGKLLV